MKTDSSVKIYSSSAGSGKTFTIVKEYLKILLGQRIWNDEIHRSILAVTFTNKATEEMRSRILQELGGISGGDDTPMKAVLLHELGGLSEDELVDRAMKFRRILLHDYGNISVMTIDSFFQRILRAFAKELDLPLGYKVSLDKEDALRQTVEGLFQEIGKEKVLSDWMESYAYFNMDEARSWDMKDSLIKLGKEMLDRSSHNPDRKIPGFEELDEARKVLFAIKKAFEVRAGELALQMSEMLDRYKINTGELYSGYLSGFLARFPDPPDPKAYYPSDTVLKMMKGEADLYAKGKPQEFKNSVDACMDAGLSSIMLDYADHLEKRWESYQSTLIVIRNIYALGAMHALQGKLAEYRSQEDLLLISDIGEILHSLISEDNAPFIFEKAGARYDYILIDEFQDTSNLQWSVLRPFLLNVVSQARPEFLHLLIVGDAKQSIYRWRGGNLRLLTEIMPDDLHRFGPVKEVLPRNFRSLSAVVRFNNVFFTNAREWLGANMKDLAKDVTESFEDVIQEAARKSDKTGSVRFNWIYYEGKKKAEWKALSLEKLEESILSLKEDFGYRYDEMAILVYQNIDAEEIAAFLHDRGHPVLSPNSLLFDNDPCVRFLMALVGLLNDPDNRVLQTTARAHLFRVRGGAMNEHEDWCPDKEDPLAREIQEFVRARRSRRVSDVYGFFIDMLRSFDLDRKDNDLIIQFLDFIMQSVDLIGNSLGELADWWEEAREKAYASSSGKAMAIEISTIHKSKGLEYPVVMIPFCEDSLTPKANSYMWVHSDQSPYQEMDDIPVHFSSALESSLFKDDYREERKLSISDSINTLYVAFTRAAEHLIVHVPVKRNKTYDGDKEVFSTTDIIVNLCETPDMQGYFEERHEEYCMKGTWDKPARKDEEGTIPEALGFTGFNREGPGVSIRSASYAEATGAAIEYGNLIHDVLAGIVRSEDLEVRLNAFRWSGQIDGDTYSRLEMDVRRILEIPEVTDWFNEGNTVETEATYYYQGKKLRPDRLVFSEDSFMVVDYKSGSPSQGHKQQVSEYVEAIEAITGKKGKGFLLYLTTEEPVVAIP